MPRKLSPMKIKCRATSKRTGRPCQRWAMVGAVPPLCFAHGAAGGRNKQESAEAREVNNTFASLLAHSPRRPPWEVALDALHCADAMMQDEWRRVVDSDEVTAEQVVRLGEVARWAHSLAASTITTRAQEVRVMIEARQVDIMSRALGRVRDDPEVGLSMERRTAFDRAMARELREAAAREEKIPPKEIEAQVKRGSR